ncbi:hypothetical protein GCM10009810_38690 [Nostocoides vanveenii]|uniref:Uncharacterized protein n=1 Tax=Nostocoides vanveenii TaxID=330835 RepID=A0ABN2L8P8_9MICO
MPRPLVLAGLVGLSGGEEGVLEGRRLCRAGLGASRPILGEQPAARDHLGEDSRPDEDGNIAQPRESAGVPRAMVRMMPAR